MIPIILLNATRLPTLGFTNQGLENSNVRFNHNKQGYTQRALIQQLLPLLLFI